MTRSTDTLVYSLKTIDVSLFVDSYLMKLGITLLFCIGVHLSAKHLLKKLDFILKSSSNLLFKNNGKFLKLTSMFLSWFWSHLVSVLVGYNIHSFY